MTAIDQILDFQRQWLSVSTDDEPAISAAAIRSLSICAEAVTILGDNLRSVGYSWVSSEPIPANILTRNIKTIERCTGLSLPKVLLDFWERIGGISFVDLENYRHTDFWEEHQIIPPSGYTDGLHIYACNDEWTSSMCSEFADWKEYQIQGESEDFLFTLSPDGYHKDNISGGAPYGVFADSNWKPVWRYFEWSGPVHPLTAIVDPPDFLAYLRTTVLECAGFPGLLGVPAFERIKMKLLQNIPLF